MGILERIENISSVLRPLNFVGIQTTSTRRFFTISIDLLYWLV